MIGTIGILGMLTTEAQRAQREEKCLIPYATLCLCGFLVFQQRCTWQSVKQIALNQLVRMQIRPGENRALGLWSTAGIVSMNSKPPNDY